jgi:uncharacterized membrane protein YoaK (UPF0700 family)
LKPDERVQFAFAVLLTGVAGCVDAIGFLKLGHLFVSFMSGDSTQFAVASAGHAWTRAGRAGGVIALFVVGVMLGRSISRVAKTWCRPAVLATEAVLFSIVILMSPASQFVVVPLVLAMGIQNSALRNVGPIQTSLTYITGTLVRFAENLTDAFSAPDKHWDWLPYFLLWLGLTLGAAAGATAYHSLGMRAVTLPMIVTAALAIIAAIIERKRGP